MRKLRTLIAVGVAACAMSLGVAVGAHQAEAVKVEAATESTVYYAVPSDVVGSYTVKLNVNFRGDGEWWNTYEMQKTLDTLDGNDVYRCTFTDAYDGVGCMQFQLYNGRHYVDQQQPVGSWTTVGNYNGKVYVHNTGWSDYTPNLETYIPMTSSFFTNWNDPSFSYPEGKGEPGQFKGAGASCWSGNMNVFGSFFDGCNDGYEGFVGTLTSRRWHQTTNWILFEWGCASDHVREGSAVEKLVFHLWSSADATTPFASYDYFNDTFSGCTMVLRNFHVSDEDFASLGGDFYMSVDLVDGRTGDYGAHEFGYLHVNQTHAQVSDAEWYYYKNCVSAERTVEQLRANFYLNTNLRDGFVTGFEEQFDTQESFNKNFLLDGSYDQNGGDRHEDKAISFANYRGWWDGSKMPFNKTGDGFFKGWHGEAQDDSNDGGARGYVYGDGPIYRFLSKPFRLPTNGIVSVKMAGTSSLHLIDFDGGNGELAFVDCKTFKTDGDEVNIAWTGKNTCTLVRHVINFSKYAGRLVQLAIADVSSGGWGAAYFDELCANYSELPGLKVDLVAQYNEFTSYSALADVYVSAKEGNGGIDYKHDDGPESDDSPLKNAASFVSDYLGRFRNYRDNGDAGFCNVAKEEGDNGGAAYINRFNSLSEAERALVCKSDDYRRANATKDNWTTTELERLSMKDSLSYLARYCNLDVSIPGVQANAYRTIGFEDSSITIVVVISLVSISALGILLVIRKKRLAK